MKKYKIFIMIIMVILLTGCFNQNFDEYIKNKGFSSTYDLVEQGNNACDLARSKGRSCNYMSYPEHNSYYNNAKEYIEYSEEYGVNIIGKNFKYLPLINTFYWWSDDYTITIKYDTKTKECINQDNNKCSDSELEEVYNMYKSKAPYLDDFKGNLKNVEF